MKRNPTMVELPGEMFAGGQPRFVPISAIVEAFGATACRCGEVKPLANGVPVCVIDKACPQHGHIPDDEARIEGPDGRVLGRIVNLGEGD